jgi:hypothetical protein
MTATQNRLMDANSGGVNSYSADDAAAEVVTAKLLQCGYRVVERQALNAVLREQGLQQSGMVDQNTAVRVGKLAGADAIVIANVYNASSNHHQGFQGGTGNTFVDVAGKLLDPSGTVHRVDMTVKLIDTQTAEVAWLADESKESRPGENTSHVQLLRDLIAALSFPSPATPSSSSEPNLGEPPPRPSKNVRTAQQHLRKLGYDPGPVDGLLGPKTREALRQFQQDRGLSANGKLDKETKEILRQQAASSTESKRPQPSSSSPPPTTGANSPSPSDPDDIVY